MTNFSLLTIHDKSHRMVSQMGSVSTLGGDPKPSIVMPLRELSTEGTLNGTTMGAFW